MSLRIVYGRAGRGKTTWCLDELTLKLADKKQQKANDLENRLILIVPEQFSHQAELNATRKFGSLSVLGVDVLTFKRMAYRVFNNVGGVKENYITPAAKSILISRILKKKEKEFGVVTSMCNKAGFIQVLIRLISEMKRYLVEPETLGQVIDNIENSTLKAKLKDIYNIYQEYEAEIRNVFADSDDDLTVLSHKIKEFQYFKNAHIYVDGFSGFTVQEYDVLTEILKVSSSLNITLCMDCLDNGCNLERGDTFFATSTVALKLLKIAGNCGISIMQPLDLNRSNTGKSRFSNNKELAALEESFATGIPRHYNKKTENIKLVLARNLFTEVEIVAADIMKLCSEKGCKFEDITVVTGNLEGYHKIIESVFSDYGIRFFIDNRKDIKNSTVVSLIIAAFDIIIKNWDYENVFRYLKTGLSDIDKNDVDIIENFALAFAIRGKRWTSTVEYTNAYLISQEADSADKIALEKFNELKAKFTDPIIKFKDKIISNNTVKSICQAVYELLEELRIYEKISNISKEFADAGDIDLANEYGKIWDSIMKTLDSIYDAYGDEKSTIEEFKAMFSAALDEFSIGIIPSTVDQVLVGSIDRSRVHNVKALYIIGINDGILPSVFNNEGLLSDQDRNELKEKGIELAEDTVGKAFAENLNVYNVLTSTSQILTLSYPASDNEGKAMRPSFVISKVKSIFKNLTIYSDIVEKNDYESEMLHVFAASPAFKNMTRFLRNSENNSGKKVFWLEVFAILHKNSEWQERCDEILKALEFKNTYKGIGIDAAVLLFGNKIYTSVTKLEKYAKCPFSYFMEFGLRARERRLLDVKAVDIGNIAHKALEMFPAYMKEQNVDYRDMNKSKCYTMASNITDQIFDGLKLNPFDESSKNKYIKVRIKKIVSRSAATFIEHINRGEFKPYGNEVAFSDNSTLPPIKIILSDGKEVIMTGKIDRIDVLQQDDGTYFRVVDYKTGSKSFSFQEFYYGLQIQLMSYITAIMNYNGNDLKLPVKPAGAFYFKVSDPYIKGNRDMSDEDIQKIQTRDLRMDGVAIDSLDIISKMDSSFIDDKDSDIIPVKLNKDGNFTKTSKVISEENFHKAVGYVNSVCSKIANDIVGGKIEAYPICISGSAPCSYCKYGEVCRFDNKFEGNKYKFLNNIENEKLWRLIDNGTK